MLDHMLEDRVTLVKKDGAVIREGIPSLVTKGKVQIQIIAKNYQTFGDTFDVTEDERTIEIKLNPPQAQYSAHEK